MADWTVVDMLDAIGANASRIPAGTKRVAIYLTGSGGIAWTNADVATLVRDDPELGLVYRIDQANNPGLTYLTLKTLVIDIEPGAATIGTAVEIARVRAAHGLRTTFYYFKAEEPAVWAAVNAAGLAEHVDYWLADWNYTRDEAAGLLHTYVAVQYRSAATVDYSVARSTWGEVQKPKPPAPKRSQALLTAVEEGKGARWEIHGVDNPGDVNIPNAEDWHVNVVKHPNGTWDAMPAPATTPKKRRLAALQIHPKVAAAAGVAAPLVAVRAALSAFGVHVPISPTEQDAIVAALPVIAAYLKSSGVTL